MTYQEFVNKYNGVGTVSYGTKLLFTKENKDWAYAPSVGGWLYLGYIKG